MQQVRGEPDCKRVRMSDIGWTDVTATSSIAAELLRGLGYESNVELLSLPVMFMSMRNADVDVFLGNWLPVQESYIKPFLADGSLVALGINLEGARFTFAVPKYVYESGVRS